MFGLEVVSNMICIEKFLDFQQLGRFTLRTEGKICLKLKNVKSGIYFLLPTVEY
ncbi:hypothetical protein Hdeb2414_s0692g00936331 [Helianthus debilis subsp. tardiflorus]